MVVWIFGWHPLSMVHPSLRASCETVFWSKRAGFIKIIINFFLCTRKMIHFRLFFIYFYWNVNFLSYNVRYGKYIRYDTYKILVWYFWIFYDRKFVKLFLFIYISEFNFFLKLKILLMTFRIFLIDFFLLNSFIYVQHEIGLVSIFFLNESKLLTFSSNLWILNVKPVWSKKSPCE